MSTQPSEGAIRSIEIKGRLVSVYPPSIELWQELQTLEARDDLANLYTFGWAADILDAVARHCARQKFAGKPNYLAMLMTAILYFWDTRIPLVAHWHGFVKHALGVFLFACVNSDLAIKRAKQATEPHPELAEDAKRRGRERFAEVAGLVEKRHNLPCPENLPTEQQIDELVRLASGLPWEDCEIGFLDLTDSKVLAANNLTLPAQLVGRTALGAAPQHPVGKSKARRRRRVPLRTPAPLTPQQTEAVQLVGEHKGDFTAAGKAAGKSRQAMKKLYLKACKKLGTKAVETATKTQRLPADRRGQSDVADPNAADLNAPEPDDRK